MFSEIAIIAICMVVAIVLLITEIFFIPGITLAGLGGAAAAIGGIWFAYQVSAMTGHITVLASLAGFAVVFFAFLRSRSFRKMELKADVSSKVVSNLEQGIQVGDQGVTVSRLASVGKANINGKIVEVKSETGWTDENQPIVVTRIEDNYIWVK